MARKARSEWTPAYRRRVERAEAKAAAAGRTLRPGEARGHKPREHVSRRDREEARVMAFVEQQERRTLDKDWPGTDEVFQELWSATRKGGMRVLAALERTIAELNAAYKANASRPLGQGALLDELASEYDLPRELLFYH